MFRLLPRLKTISWLLPACFCACATVSSAETRLMVCNDGAGHFSTALASGVSISVGPVKTAAFAKRTCDAILSWDDQQLVVTPDASRVDIDVLGVDLGLGSPVVGLQIKKAKFDPLMQYEIYSLDKSPRKLRTITGGDYFRAADTDMDGRIEIWTGDAGTIDGFESLPRSAFDSAPTVVLRYEQQKLMDVSAEFQSDYDRQIANLRARLDAQQLNDFKASDGALLDSNPQPGEDPTDELDPLVSTKVKVLEIVWCYLYSGREQEAWKALAEMWPPADITRIRSSLLNARLHGIRSQVAGVSDGSSRSKKRVQVYDQMYEHQKDAAVSGFQADTYPQRILLPLPPANEALGASQDAEVKVDLVLDAAGKVRSAKMAGTADQNMIAAAMEWKFIPAYKGGKPIASRFRISVTPLK